MGCLHAPRTASRAALVLLAVLLLGGPAVTAALTGRPAGHAKKRAFAIKGKPRVKLHPGTSALVHVKLRNRRHQALWITQLKLRLRVDKRHRAAGCSGRRDFAVLQLPGGAFPFRLPASHRGGRAWRTLRSLGVLRAPGITMLDLPLVNQDACKGARLRVLFSGKARKTRPRGRPAVPAAPTPAPTIGAP